MVIRVVRMHFKPENRQEFLMIFDKNMTAIRNFPGCTHLELLKDPDRENTYTTLSYWMEQKHLEAYRKSELFESVWSRVKLLFAARPEAFTLLKYIEV